MITNHSKQLLIGVGIVALVWFITKKPAASPAGVSAINRRASQHGYDVPKSQRNLPDIYYRISDQAVAQDPPYVWPYVPTNL